MNGPLPRPQRALAPEETDRRPARWAAGQADATEWPWPVTGTGRRCPGQRRQYAYSPPGLYLVPQAVFDGTAYFAAPPTSVTTMTVSVAELGAIAAPLNSEGPRCSRSAW